MRFRIVQCVCPARHAILAMVIRTPVEDLTDRDAATNLRALLLVLTGDDAVPAWVVDLGLPAAKMNPHCGICGAARETWQYEVAWSKAFADWDAALQALKASEAQQREDRAMMDLLDLTFDATRDRPVH